MKPSLGIATMFQGRSHTQEQVTNRKCTQRYFCGFFFVSFCVVLACSVLLDFFLFIFISVFLVFFVCFLIFLFWNGGDIELGG